MPAEPASAVAAEIETGIRSESSWPAKRPDSDRLERVRQALLRRQHALEEIAVFTNPVEDDRHRERERIEVLVDLTE